MMQQQNLTGFRALNVVATVKSGAWERNWQWLRKPSNARLIAKVIAPGFQGNPAYDLTQHGGRTVANASVQYFYVGSANVHDTNHWADADRTAIDSALDKALADPGLNTVIAQYFSVPSTVTVAASQTLTNTATVFHP